MNRIKGWAATLRRERDHLRTLPHPTVAQAQRMVAITRELRQRSKDAATASWTQNATQRQTAKPDETEQPIRDR